MSPDQIIATLIALMSQATEPAFDPLKSGGHDDRYRSPSKPARAPSVRWKSRAAP